MSDTDTTDATDDTNSTTKIDSRDDIPDRDTLVELRRDNGLTNEDIAENWVTEFSPREIGLFCAMYDIEKGWKDADYLQAQMEAGVTPAELAEGWPITEDTVRNWMKRLDVEENPIPDAYTDAIAALEGLQEATEEYGGDDLKRNYDEYGEIATQLETDFDDWKSA